MGSAEVSLAKGLASIANGAALKRVNTELTAAIQSVLSGNSTSGTSSSSGSSSSTSSGTSASPATAVGTAPLTTSTSLATLGIPAGASISVSAGGNTTTYASTGSDTVGDLMNAINQDYYGNAAVTASLNHNGDLVLTSKNTTDTITVGGVYTSNIGFSVGHTTFKPTPASSSASTSSAATSSSSSATSASTSKSSTTSTSYTTASSEAMSSAASLLSDSGVAGSIVDLLA
jgi:hypothetical protein